jgi:hypothetical protein
MKRDHSEWWVDQHGQRWSARALFHAERADAGEEDRLRRIATDDDAGVRVYERGDETLHLVRVPAPTPEDGLAGRALLTEDERAALDDERVRDRVRWRVAVELPQDLAALRAADPALYDRVRAAVTEAEPPEEGAADETFIPAEDGQ